MKLTILFILIMLALSVVIDKDINYIIGWGFLLIFSSLEELKETIKTKI